MIAKIIKLIQTRCLALPEEKKMSLLLECYTILYGNEQIAQIEFDKHTSNNSEEVDLQYQNESNFPFLYQILSILNTNTFTGLIVGVKEINDTAEILVQGVVNPELLQRQLDTMPAVANLYFKTIFNLKGDVQLTKEIVADIIKNEVYYTKEEIANEFGIDKKTLNKWLKFLSAEKFHGRKKLTVLEYQEIFNLLFLANNESQLDLNVQIEFYIKRLQNMSFSKNELVEITASDYKTLKDNSEKAIGFYDELNVYPFSVADKLIKKMGAEPLHQPKTAK